MLYIKVHEHGQSLVIF